MICDFAGCAVEATIEIGIRRGRSHTEPTHCCKQHLMECALMVAALIRRNLVKGEITMHFLDEPAQQALPLSSA